MTTYNVSNLDSNASVVTVTSQGPQGADAVLQAGNRGDFTVAIAGNGSQTATINTGAITSDKILDGTILNADINASAGILGTKISPNFGSQNITTTGNIAGAGGTFSNDLSIINTIPTINLTNTISNSDYRIQNYSGTFTIKDVTNDSNRLTIASDGTANFSGNLDVGAGLDITGDITVTGLVDSVDIAARDTLFGGLTSSSGVLTNGVTATTQSAGDNSTKVATTAYTDTAISNLVDSSPAALNTLNELAAALGDDANFSTTVTNSIATKLSLSGGTIDGNVIFNDTKKLLFGSDSDFKIVHSGDLADIVNTTGNLRLTTGTNNNILFRTQNNDSTHTNIIVCDGTNESEHVDLYHSGNRRLATESDGVRVVGTLKTGFEGDLPTLSSQTRAVFSGSFTTGETQNSTSAISILCKGGANSRINLGTDTNENQSQIKYRKANNDIQFLVTDPSDNQLNSLLEINSNSCKLNYAGSKKAETSATGFDITGILTATGNIDLTDSSNILLGTDDDLDISHNGTVAKIKNSTGDFNIQGNVIRLLNQAGGETYLTATANDALSLFFDDTERAKTSSTGFDVLGFLNTTHSTNGYSIFKTENAGSGLKIASKTASSVARLVFSNNHSGTLANNWFIEAGFISSNYFFTVGKGDLDSTTATPMLQISDAVILNYADTVNGSFSSKAQTSSTGFEVLGDLKVTGDIISEDKFITLANIATPTDTQAANSGLYIKGSTDKHFRYQTGNNSFNSTENITIAADKKLRFQSKFEIFNSSGIGQNNYDSGATNFDNTVNYSQDDKVINNHRVYQAQATISSGQGAPTHTTGTSGNWTLLGFVNATTFDNSVNYTQDALVLNGNKVYQAQATINSGQGAPTHANATVSNWLFVRIADGEVGQYIKDASTGPLKILTSTLQIKNANDNKLSASFIPNGAVNLLYNNEPKLSTTDTGINVKGGILFNDDTADANTLDDYEEGTFTPLLQGSSGNPTSVTYTVQSGHYTKIGNLVHIQVSLSVSAYTGGGGEFQLGGLPFTALAAAPTATVNYNQNNKINWGSQVLDLSFYIAPNSTQVRGRKFKANGNSGLNLVAFATDGFSFGITGTYLV